MCRGGKCRGDSGHIPECKQLVLLQVNHRSICNKFSECWNLIDTYKSDVVIGTESWLSEEIDNAKIFGRLHKIQEG